MDFVRAQTHTYIYFICTIFAPFNKPFSCCRRCHHKEDLKTKQPKMYKKDTYEQKQNRTARNKSFSSYITVSYQKCKLKLRFYLIAQAQLSNSHMLLNNVDEMLQKVVENSFNQVSFSFCLKIFNKTSQKSQIKNQEKIVTSCFLMAVYKRKDLLEEIWSLHTHKYIYIYISTFSSYHF